LELTPTTEAQWIDRGLLELPIDPNKAVESFHQALQINPRSSDARQKLAYVFAELLHDTDASLEQLNALIESLPQYPVHRAGRAVLYARQGDSAKALSDVEELEEMPSLEPLVRYQVACVYSLLGKHTLSQNDTDTEQKNLKEGMKWLRNATLLDSSFIEIANSDPDLEWLRGNPTYSPVDRSSPLVPSTLEQTDILRQKTPLRIHVGLAKAYAKTIFKMLETIASIGASRRPIDVHGEEISFLGFGSLTYSYAPDGTAVGRGENSLFATFDQVATRAQWQEAIAKAIQTWSVHANINIGLVQDSGGRLWSLWPHTRRRTIWGCSNHWF
jgi:tetratricopeptide (TPR) repeat protein